MQNERREHQLQQVYGNGVGTHRSDNHRAGLDTSLRNPGGGRHNHEENQDSRIGVRERNSCELRRALQTWEVHTGELVLDELEKCGVASWQDAPYLHHQVIDDLRLVRGCIQDETSPIGGINAY